MGQEAAADEGVMIDEQRRRSAYAARADPGSRSPSRKASAVRPRSSAAAAPRSPTSVSTSATSQIEAAGRYNAHAVGDGGQQREGHEMPTTICSEHAGDHSHDRRARRRPRNAVAVGAAIREQRQGRSARSRTRRRTSVLPVDAEQPSRSATRALRRRRDRRTCESNRAANPPSRGFALAAVARRRGLVSTHPGSCTSMMRARTQAGAGADRYAAQPSRRARACAPRVPFLPRPTAWACLTARGGGGGP